MGRLRSRKLDVLIEAPALNPTLPTCRDVRVADENGADCFHNCNLRPVDSQTLLDYLVTILRWMTILMTHLHG